MSIGDTSGAVAAPDQTPAPGQSVHPNLWPSTIHAAVAAAKVGPFVERLLLQLTVQERAATLAHRPSVPRYDIGVNQSGLGRRDDLSIALRSGSGGATWRDEWAVCVVVVGPVRAHENLVGRR
jgi:hypothetical protein